MKKLTIVLFILLALNNIVIAMPNLRLPFVGGEVWSVSCAYQEDPVGSCWTHRAGQKDEYALDFNTDNDCGKDVVSTDDGIVSFAVFGNFGYGNYIKIDHGDSYVSIYGHLRTINVVKGELVRQGQKIGESGNTGNSSGCHLHFALYRADAGVKPEPISGYTGIKNGSGPYASDNYFNLTSFTFDGRSGYGWTPGSDTEISPANGTSEWQVRVIGSNPGIVSPTFAAEMVAKDFVIRFSARVLGNNAPEDAYLWFKDETGNWNNRANIGTVSTSQNYYFYEVNLANAWAQSGNRELRQFSLELTDGGNGSNEYWSLDWLKILSKSVLWDFIDKTLGWTIKQYAKQADFFASDWWRIEPTGKQPQIVSPYLYDIPADYIKVGIRYSI